MNASNTLLLTSDRWLVVWFSATNIIDKVAWYTFKSNWSTFQKNISLMTLANWPREGQCMVFMETPFVPKNIIEILVAHDNYIPSIPCHLLCISWTMPCCTSSPSLPSCTVHRTVSVLHVKDGIRVLVSRHAQSTFAKSEDQPSERQTLTRCSPMQIFSSIFFILPLAIDYLKNRILLYQIFSIFYSWALIVCSTNMCSFHSSLFILVICRKYHVN